MAEVFNLAGLQGGLLQVGHLHSAVAPCDGSAGQRGRFAYGRAKFCRFCRPVVIQAGPGQQFFKAGHLEFTF